MARAPARRIKSNRTYDFREAAEAAQVTVQTIRAWAKRGLRVMSESRPFLILGADLKAFIEGARQAKKQPLKIGRFFCMSCQCPQPPAFDMADYEPKSASHGRLTAFCAVCGGPISRIVRKSALPAWRDLCEIGGDHD